METATTTDLPGAAERVRAALDAAAAGLVERRSLVEAVALAAVAREHVLVLGPPGTAKSEAVRRVAQATGGAYFEYLLGRFTEPSEIFGPVDLRRLREGRVETETAGMLPEAEIAFLDEIFLGSTAILNTLLGLLNERVFRRGHTLRQCPLRVCVGAANTLPADEALAAFADRFLLRIYVDPIPDPRLEELLAGGWSLTTVASDPEAGMADLDLLAEAARGAQMEAIRPHLAHALRLLRHAGIFLSDRRAVKVQRLVAAAALLAGRTRPTEADLWPLVFAVPLQEEQALAREALRDLLRASENGALPVAAEEASAGPVARAARLGQTARETIAAGPHAETGGREAWLLRLEGIAREIDAGFAREQLPPDLLEVRDALAGLVEGPAP